MTDRDTFAAAALTGLLARPDVDADPLEYHFACEDAYKWADAMLRERDKTNHDAAPAARASVESVVPQPTTQGDSDRTDQAAPQPCEGTGDISEAQIDALECVVEDGRIVGMSVYGHLRSLLVRLRPEWEAGPDPDSRVWETPRTPPPRATPPQGSVPSEGSVPDSGNWKEPVAWWLKGAEYDTGCEYEYVSLVKESAEAAAKEGGTVTPLYAHPQPTLTHAEREAVEGVIAVEHQRGAWRWADTLRELLERLS